MSNAADYLTVRQLAEQLGVTKQTIQNRADALGIVFSIQGNKRIVTPEQAEQIRQGIQTQRTGHQERQQRRSSRSKADTGTTDAADSMTVDLLRDQLRHQAEEIQFLRSLVVSLQNEKSALLQLAGPTQSEQTDPGPTDNSNLDPAAADLHADPGADDPGNNPAQDIAADLRAAPEPAPDQEPPAPAAQDTEPATLWGKIKAFFKA